MSRPRGIAHRDIERVVVGGFVFSPRDHRIGERELAVDAFRPNADARLDVARERRAIECRRFVRLVLVHRLALDERPLHRVQRRELVMARLQRKNIDLDSKKVRDEVLEVRCQRDQELRLGLCRQRRWIGAGGDEPVRQRRVGLRKVRQEERVDARGALDRIEVGEGQAMSKTQR
jgi:hypothetical protein